MMTKEQKYQQLRQRMSYHAAVAKVAINNSDQAGATEAFNVSAGHGLEAIQFADQNNLPVENLFLLNFCNIRINAGLLEGTDEFIDRGIKGSHGDEELQREFINTQETFSAMMVQ
jgi:hypothetical protein